jgi:phage tail sheath gpL-like
VALVGNPNATVANAIAVPNARTTDYINVAIPAPGSIDLPFVIAARAAARIAVRANNDPAYDYAGLTLDTITPGTDAQQWTYAQRDAALKGGCSTIELKDGVVELSDTVTFYHPSGDETPAYRYVVDVMKIMNILYNTNLIFDSDDWRGRPLIPDGQATVNGNARSPSTAKAQVFAMLDSLGSFAIISDPATAKGTVVAEIDSMNPKRLNVAFTVQLSGNVGIISIDFNFGFYYGTPTLVG